MAAAPAPRRPTPAKPALRVVKAADVVDEDKQRLADSGRAARRPKTRPPAIREMMNAPKRVLVPPRSPRSPSRPMRPSIKGTIHKKAGQARRAAAAPGAAKPGEKKSVKSEKLSSSWADDAAKRRGAEDAHDAGGGARPGWRAPRGGAAATATTAAAALQAPVEQQVQEVHVPETISVADLAHKMSVKASEVIKQLMKLGQMVTINQQLDQETAMILVEEMGHKALRRQARRPRGLPRGGRGPRATPSRCRARRS